MREGNQKEFTKADLKDGMVVEERRGVMGFVLRDRILYEDGWDSLVSWKEDLRSNCCDGFDIVKIYKIIIESIYELSNILNIENLELIWRRTEIKRMTAEEMRKRLEELTSEKIEVEPSREEMIGKIKLYCSKRSRCAGCVLVDMGRRCNYWKFDSLKLKQCYEKVMEDGRKES